MYENIEPNIPLNVFAGGRWETKNATGSGRGGKGPGGGALGDRLAAGMGAGGGSISAVSANGCPGAGCVMSTSISFIGTGGGGGPDTGTGGGRRSSEGLKDCHCDKSGRGYLSTSTGSNSGRFEASLLRFCVVGGAAVATAAVAVGTATTLSVPIVQRMVRKIFLQVHPMILPCPPSSSSLIASISK